MKNVLSVTTLLSIAALLTTVAFELAGGAVASPLPYAVPFALFVAGLVLATFREDYTAVQRPYEPRPDRVRPILLPADEVFAAATTARPGRTVNPVAWPARHRRTRRAVARV